MMTMEEFVEQSRFLEVNTNHKTLVQMFVQKLSLFSQCSSLSWANIRNGLHRLNLETTNCTQGSSDKIFGKAFLYLWIYHRCWKCYFRSSQCCILRNLLWNINSCTFSSGLSIWTLLIKNLYILIVYLHAIFRPHLKFVCKVLSNLISL